MHLTPMCCGVQVQNHTPPPKNLLKGIHSVLAFRSVTIGAGAMSQQTYRRWIDGVLEGFSRFLCWFLCIQVA